MRLRIASYNIHKAVGLDRRRDPARILEVLNEIAADVVVLQEVDRRLGARPSALPRFLIEQETDYAVVDLARNDVSLGWHGNAVLVRPGLAIGDVAHIDLPGLEPRGAVRIDVDGGLTVVGTHLGLLRPWRIRQQRAIRDAVDARASRTVIAGDFNEWAVRTGFEPWDGVFDVQTPGRSFHTARPIAPLDRFALGKKLRLHGAGVVRQGAARVASDHLPVWADVEVSG
ncbi:endonuclease/exonuclease/phosphatase family protein [Ovoidimarina sediminis]|uniref:endonuclease/exonuclease/phosphatase family protein n=1 Tax=Ovoidimarina sediminis TaxID=3079856 RepID=UPI00291392C7|nr:endonuclease/exonuclease/phosphatase family protein [Rhodophyticola sp. MJ-SS7]MDU8945393.1 endonuclease/exonuclease/phosphatase family protein [Rhodophyticola sp. MJ-SS7]